MKPKTIYTFFEKADPVLFGAIKNKDFKLITASPSKDFFTNLCREIISQQLSVKAGGTIHSRFLLLFPAKKVTPQQVTILPHETIRSAGLSSNKIIFIKDLAQKILDKSLDLEKLLGMENALVIKELTKVKGIGPWTAEMFLMFSLGREDLFSPGDLGLKNAIKKLYKLENPTQKQIEKISGKWSPYRTYACIILWESLGARS